MEKLDLLYIDPSKGCLKFLEERLSVDNYRGMQISQHNRYELSHILDILSLLYKKSGKEKMEIRTTDIKKRQFNNPNETKFAEFVHEVNIKTGRFTQDSIRKNLFVDLHRMGLINRYNADTLVAPNQQKKITSISISEKGIELIDDKLNILERQMIFSEAIDNLLKGFALKIMNVLSELGNKIELLEFVFFISFLDQKIGEELYSEEDIIRLVKEYRTLPVEVKNFVELQIKDYADPKKFKGNKKEKRDYHNWINESQQIFSLLDQTALYEYDKKNKTLSFRFDKKDALFKKSDFIKLKRSPKQKRLYFENHSVSKKIGYELHHIVPLLRAKNADHFFLLDVWENLLYIDGKKHSIISQSGNKKIVLNILENNDIELTDLREPLFLKFNDNVFYDPNNIEKMKNKNKNLLETLRGI